MKVITFANASLMHLVASTKRFLDMLKNFDRIDWMSATSIILAVLFFPMLWFSVTPFWLINAVIISGNVLFLLPIFIRIIKKQELTEVQLFAICTFILWAAMFYKMIKGF